MSGFSINIENVSSETWDDFIKNDVPTLTLNKITVNGKTIDLDNGKLIKNTHFPQKSAGGSLVKQKKTKKRKLFNSKKRTRVKR
jgi:hypothetical protein